MGSAGDGDDRDDPHHAGDEGGRERGAGRRGVAGPRARPAGGGAVGGATGVRRHIEEAFASRNHPQWREIDGIVRDGVLGEVHAIQGTIAKRFLDPHDIRNDPDAGGGALYDLGSYVISACNLILGRPPLRVVAAMERDPEFRVDRLSTALLDYGDAHASFTAATQSGTSARGTHQQLSVLGSEGWLRCDFPLPAPVRRAATSTWATRRASAPSRRGRPRTSR